MLTTFRRLWSLVSGRSLPARERRVRRRLRPFLSEYEELIALCYDYIARTADTYAANPELQRPVANLQLVLLMRLQADLRVCVRCARDGYPFQALTVASAIHEISYALIYLGDSDDRARKWTEHTNARKQYPESGHRSAIESAKAYFPLTPGEIEQEYGIYGQLCWGKHGNPILQTEYGVIDKGAVAEVQQLPYYSTRTVAYARYALLHSARAVGAALVVFTTLHLIPKAPQTLMDHLMAIGPSLNKLGTRDGLMEPRL